MKYLIALFILVTGLIVYAIKPKYLIFYWMTWQPIVIPLLIFITGTIDVDEEMLVSNSVNTVGAFYLFGFLVILKLLRGKKIYFSKLLLTRWVILYAYVLFMTCITHFSSDVIKEYAIETSILILPFIFLSIIEEAQRPTMHELAVFSIILITVEACAVFLNTQGIYFTVSSYLGTNFKTATGEAVNLVSGTFIRFNALTNYLTTLFLYISLQFFDDGKLKKYIYYSLAVAIGLMVLLSGAKMSLALYFYTIFICIYVYRRKKLLSIAFLFVFAILIVGNSLPLIADAFPGAERIIYGFEDFMENGSDDEGATTSLSEYLINQYFYDSPILGNWRRWMGADAYLWRHYDMIIFKADARLAYILVEVGLMGFVLYMFFFTSFFECIYKRVVSRERIKLKIIFVYFAIMSITEPGFFDPCIFPLSFIYLFCCLKYSKKVCKQQRGIMMISQPNEC